MRITAHHVRIVWVALLVACLLAPGSQEGAQAEEGVAPQPTRHVARTKHGGNQAYVKHWNWWARVGGQVLQPDDRFFPDFERTSPEITALIDALGAPKGPAATEAQVWSRIGLVWNWWRKHVRVDNAAYGAIDGTRDGWPGFVHFAAYYKQHKGLVCAACFSKAHLFACLLGRILYPRDRIAIASAHHTMNGAPPTASHVYVAVYVGERWFYFDSTYAQQHAWPTFEDRRSLGAPRETSVDYAHPFKVLPLPGSTLARVPLLGTP